MDPYDAAMSNAQNVSAAWKDAFEAGKTGGQEHPGDGGSWIRTLVFDIFGALSKFIDFLCGGCGTMEKIQWAVVIFILGPHLIPWIILLINLIMNVAQPIVAIIFKFIIYIVKLLYNLFYNLISYSRNLMSYSTNMISSNVKAYIDDDEK